MKSKARPRGGLGCAGIVLVRGPRVCGGDVNDMGPAPFKAFEGETRYRTGNRVMRDPQDRLIFVGRFAPVAKIGGEMVSPPAIEEVLSRAYVRREDTGPCVAVVDAPRTTSVPTSSYRRFDGCFPRK